MDYYHRKKFVCEITGNSCLTFFQATESEAKEIQEVEKNFPEALKEHILRFLQFNRITRLDQLVDKVYLVFKNDYFPGETIILKGSILNGQAESGTRQRGTIKEKIQYSNPSDGLLTKYLVVRANDQKQAIVINEKISRDRNHFTKWLIKAFIKLTMTRSHKVGAPWVVKNKFAKKYRINQKYPDDLVHFQSSTPSGDIIYEGDELPSAVADAPNGYRKLIKKSAAPSSKNLKKKAALNSILDEPPPVTAQEDDIKRRLPPHHMPDILSEADEEINKSSPQPAYPTSKKLTVSDLNLKFNLQYSKPIPEVLNVPENAKSWNGHLIQKHKEEQKTDERLDPELGLEIKRLGIRSVKSIQDALESWVFLNVYHTVLKFDTFTFDDFIYAMGWTHDQFEKIGRCELLDEIWCAVLGAIVSNEAPKNKSLKLDSDVIYGLQITLPPENSYINSPSKDDNDVGIEERGSDSDNEENILKSEDEADNDESHESLEMTNGNKDDAKIKTEQGVKLDDENDGDDEEEEEEEDNDENNENGDSLNEDDDREHNAYIVMNYRNIPWHERLRKRNFRDGNWQCILLGVLSLVEYVPAFKPIINKVYRILAPVDMPATTSTVMNQFYDDLDIDLRLQVLNILVSLLMNGTQVRNYIDECLDSSTVLRRNRLDNIRDYKVAYDLAQKLHVEIHEKLTDAKEATENAKSKSKSKSKNKLKGKDSQSTPNPDSNKRRMPRLNLQAFEMSEQESKLAESDKGFKDLCDQRKETLLSIEKYKQAKRQLEKQLNEIDCQRVKLLGKDRLYNRYWWFENNGLPTLHSNTNDVDDNDDDDNAAPNMNNDEDDEIVEDENAVLDETYLMGKLWVQGPSDDDLRIHFGSSLEDVDKYHNLYLNYEQELEKFYKCNNDQGESGEDSKQSIKEPFKQMDFNKLPLGFRSMSSEMFGLSFESNQVTRTLEDSIEKDIVIDHLGGLSVTSLTNYLTPLQRKILEENPDPLFSGSYWRFYDKPEQVTKLIEWLNPWGERESLLRKELLIVKEAIVQSMAARRKALSLDQQEAKELELENNIRQITEKLKSLGKDVNSLSNLNEEGVGKDDTEENDDENDEDEDELRLGRNKRLRNQPLPTKRQKTKSFSDVIGSDNVNDLSKVYTDLLNELQESKEEKELSRVLEWVNSKAIDKFDRSLYEGGDRSKTKTKSNK
ncbi:uncharacterized protein AC631_02748 [Debaryomyces fabryi]|uniref:WAC domain-containing protein n=1 Tax=Debaryomyces fabryi TaxID=58627 RepID=A0A0V1PZ49_9ASCO|nr:uncharacterized protein AC631_02748 [Debaryomyces fabryi]KSA01527.1 hypothetical protein AC631_02748 [Debaryomyces fabryi]